MKNSKENSKLPKLTGQSLVLFCEVSRQLACLNNWIVIEIGEKGHLSLNQPRIALGSLEC